MTEPRDNDLTRADTLLLDFLSDHDADCPVCGYNLKALTRPVCPECGHALRLTVGTSKLTLKWLLTAVAPGFFSGVAAFFFLIPVLGQWIGGGRAMRASAILFTCVDLFGWSSLVFAILLARKRHRFLAMPLSKQRWGALGVWAVHIMALATFILIAIWRF